MNFATTIGYAAAIFLVTVVIFTYLRPRYFATGPTKTKEGFATVALNRTDFPGCLARDYDAQKLLANLKNAGTASQDAAAAYEELSLIVQKLVCMDADITSLGAGVYASLRLPFNTQHDMEPVGTFVGRCLKNAVRDRDISLTLGKLRDRATILIGALCSTSGSQAEALKLLDAVVTRTDSNIRRVCLTEHASMDIPAGKRDPGYFMPAFVQGQAPYQNTAPNFHFN